MVNGFKTNIKTEDQVPVAEKTQPPNMTPEVKSMLHRLHQLMLVCLACLCFISSLSFPPRAIASVSAKKWREKILRAHDLRESYKTADAIKIL
ncbi:MAG: hypothetical protein K2Z81_24105, partial [Cyanobacteria bacterium]|nr:hypothetical protein [Cyanobacteriota bacterium]